MSSGGRASLRNDILFGPWRMTDVAKSGSWEGYCCQRIGNIRAQFHKFREKKSSFLGDEICEDEEDEDAAEITSNLN